MGQPRHPKTSRKVRNRTNHERANRWRVRAQSEHRTHSQREQEIEGFHVKTPMDGDGDGPLRIDAYAKYAKQFETSTRDRKQSAEEMADSLPLPTSPLPREIVMRRRESTDNASVLSRESMYFEDRKENYAETPNGGTSITPTPSSLNQQRLPGQAMDVFGMTSPT